MEPARRPLFAEEELPVWLVHDPAARDRLQAMLGKMRAAATWPWKHATVCFYRETVWPSLLNKLPDENEAARLRTEMDAEITRLDAAE